MQNVWGTNKVHYGRCASRELVSQNYETPAMLVSQTNPVGDHSFLM